MGRLSPNKYYITIDCKKNPELHDMFYNLKKQTNMMFRKKLTNREFIQIVLNTYAERLTEERKRRVLTSY
jgi:hypothetical protein